MLHERSSGPEDGEEMHDDSAEETVVESAAAPGSSTGLFFAEQTAAAVIDAVERFEGREQEFAPEAIRRHARGFGEDVYLDRFARLLRGYVDGR